MKHEARESFLLWEGYVFDFLKEMVDFCVSAVNILTQIFLKFR